MIRMTYTPKLKALKFLTYWEAFAKIIAYAKLDSERIVIHIAVHSLTIKAES